jgi:phthalate 4,5-cis-dihydrodiol dehydrogenase
MSARIGIGIAGWGAAGRLMAGAVARSTRFRLAGVADLDPGAREHAAKATGVAVVREVDDLAALPDVASVYLATPTRFHVSGVAAVARAGKHVVCEKPLAADVDDALAAVHAARAAGVVLIVGATHALDAPVRALRRVVTEGRLGPLLSVESSCHTDWHRRRRTPEDLDASLGNGLVLRQGAHQFDMLRLICGGEALTVSGSTFGASGTPEPGKELGFGAQIAFADGIRAYAYYSGTGGFDSRLNSWGIGETGTVDIAPSSPLTDHFILPGSGAPPNPAPMFGRTIATFAEGGVQVTPRGLLLFDADGASEIDVTAEPSGWAAVLDQLDRAVSGRTPTAYTGEWGVATLELCLALQRSAETGETAVLRHQVRLPDSHPQETR